MTDVESDDELDDDGRSGPLLPPDDRLWRHPSEVHASGGGHRALLSGRTWPVAVLAGTIGTKGGPVTDTDWQVLRADGSPVPGLYAAGNVAAFWTADGYPGPGATLAAGMTMGYRAGRHAGRNVR